MSKLRIVAPGGNTFTVDNGDGTTTEWVTEYPYAPESVRFIFDVDAGMPDDPDVEAALVIEETP